MRRWVIALGVLVTAASAVPLAQKDKKQDEAQKREIQNVVKIVDDMAAGQPGPNDLGLTWAREDYLKAQGNKEYIPFTVTIDSSKVTGGTVAFYWRVVAKNAATEAAPPPGKNDTDKNDKNDKNDKKNAAKYAYEDLAFVPAPSNQLVTRISRSFTVPAGDYDVSVVAKEPTPENRRRTRRRRRPPS